MDLKKLISMLHPLELQVIPHLTKCKSLKELVGASGLKDVEVMRALQWLSNKNILKIDSIERKIVLLDELGIKYLKQGLPEKKFLESLKRKPLSLQEVQKLTNLDKNEISVSLGLLKRRGFIDFEGGMLKITASGKKFFEKESLEERLLKRIGGRGIDISLLKPEGKAVLQDMNKRKGLIKLQLLKIKNIKLTVLGERLAKTKIKVEKVVDKLTPEMIRTGSWKGKPYRRYDVSINVPQIFGGKRHFVRGTIDYVKRIWLDLGFKEMRGNMVQTSFWNLDSLFIPQDHPARQMQDTFYIKDKKDILSGTLPKNFKGVKAMHETGGDTGSFGWQAPWSMEEAKKVLLRTHTTVLSAQTIAKLKKEELPAKFFSVNRVFRNEALDWSHLFEFNQVEGIVVDPDANFSNLLGYLREFFGKMGYKDARIRPAHFPYTEPSAEIDVLHPTRNEWIELGGCGIFRPEVVKPLLGIDVPVLAWGFGLGRIILPYYGINDLRDLYKNDLKQIREMKEWLK